MSDKLVFDLSQEVDSTANVFINKSWLNILDNQNGQYNSNQSVIDTSQLTNSNKYMSYREAYLAMPLLLTLGGIVPASYSSLTPAVAANSCDYSMSLKCWFGTMIHSISTDLNGVTIQQQTPFANVWNSFKLITTLSLNDVVCEGPSIGFYVDDPLAWSYRSIASTSGCGVCNNSNFASNAFGTIVSGAFNSYKSANGNIGFLTRQQYINYNPAGISGSATFAGQLSAAGSQQLWKSYVSTRTNGVNNTTQGVFQISIMAQIQLKHLHSFFNYMPLLKGVYMKITLNLNNCTTEFSSAGVGGILTLNSVSNAVGGFNPLMIASAAANNGNAAAFPTAASTFRANVSVGATCLDAGLTSAPNNSVGQGQLARSIYLYLPSYAFSPVFESAYISSPIKTINYTDIYQYQITNIPPNGQINNLVSNGIAGIKSVLVVPFYSAATNLIIGNGTGPLPAYQSCYDPAGTCGTSPLAHLTNFNVVISGANMIYNTQKYSFEQFTNQLYGCNSVNSGLTDGLSSGLIGQLGFEHSQCYYYVNCSRMLESETNVPKSISIVGQNASAVQMDYFIFVEYSNTISIDAISGARV